MNVIITQIRRVWLPVLLLWNAGLIVPLPSHGQSPSVKTGATSRSKAGTNMTPKEFTLSGNSLTLNLDRQGTSFTVSSYSAGATSEDITFRQQMLIYPVAFGVKDGCNGWFSKEAIFILNQSWTIKVPWAADCPLPPNAKYLPIWALESMASANSLAMKLDGKTITISAGQLSALKSFVESRILPDATWRSIHEPYAVSMSTSALSFANDLLTNSPGDMWDVRRRTYLNQSATLEADDHRLTIHAYGSPDPQKEDGLVSIRKSWSLSWADVNLANGQFLVCDRNAKCLSTHTTKNFNVEGTRPFATNDDATEASLFAAPYVPRNSAFSDFNRVTAYMWYQNMFVTQAR